MNKHLRRAVDHLWGPTGSVILHIIVVFLLINYLVWETDVKSAEVEVKLMDPEVLDQDELQEILDKLQDMDSPMTDVDIPDVQLNDVPDPTEFDAPQPMEDFAALDILSDVQGPLILKGLMAGRSAAGRISALRQFAGRYGEMTEPAVIKALEWLKYHQKPDGSWETGEARGDVYQAAVTSLGLLAFLAGWLLFRRGRHAMLASLALPSLLLAGAVLGAILVFGQKFRGAVFLPGQVNPAEVVKVLLAIFLAGVITDFLKPLQQTVAGLPAPPMRSLLTLAVLWAIPMALLMAQRDLGMILLLNLVLLILLFMATGKGGYLVVGLGFAALAMYAGYYFFSHARIRYLVWLDPFADPTGRGWQILQSLSAMFSGGLWGSGLGAGAPAVVPIAASDFVYAALAEELGFVGCAVLMLLYMVLFYRGYRIADHVRAPFGQTLAAGLTTMLAVQTLMNLGGVTKAIPLTGITLPLISHGGSSLVTTLFMLGLLVALSEPAGPKKR